MSIGIGIAGAGAFGTALAIALSRQGTDVHLWARDGQQARQMQSSRKASDRLPGFDLPPSLTVTADLGDLTQAIILLAVPTQSLPGFLNSAPAHFAHSALVACCKGIDLKSLAGPTSSIITVFPKATAAILTGPSFAVDIAAGLPTALTLATASEADGEWLQTQLKCETLRLYRTTDVTGAELGGALKNVMAIACGAAMGAGLGESARAALVTRGFAEMQRLALHLGADAGTLAGLSGFGDLVLTCTSSTSRNYRFGVALAQGETLAKGTTVEGAATAKAALGLARQHNIDMPITGVVSDLSNGKLTVKQAMADLLSRPQTKE